MSTIPTEMTMSHDADPFCKRDACIDRLLRECKKHKKLIVAVDFDDTVYPYTNTAGTHEGIIDLLKQCQELDFHIVVFTASTPDRYPFIENYMAKIGIKITGINKNAVEGLPFGNHGKIYYNILLDDRAGLWEARCILQSVINSIKLK
jgi:hypothetical protein